MGWWQIGLIALNVIVVGAIGFMLVTFLRARRQSQPTAPRPARVIESPPKPLSPDSPTLFVSPPSEPTVRMNPSPPKVTPRPAGIASRPPVQPTAVKRPAATSGLMAELKSNLRAAKGAWSGTLVSYQTHSWDSGADEINSLPSDIREELAQVYADIALANSIVWLATELSRRNQNLDENYTKLRTAIGERLGTVMARLNQPAR